MPIRLSPPIVNDYVLEKSDKHFGNEGEPTRISVRQATQGDYEARERAYSQFDRKVDPSGNVLISSDITFGELARYETFLTLAACNLEDTGGKPVFTFVEGRLKDRKLFERQWALLDPIIAKEIHELVLELNPMWLFPTNQETLENED